MGPETGADHDRTPDVCVVHDMDGDEGVLGTLGDVLNTLTDGLSPPPLTATTWNVYVVPVRSPVRTMDVPDDVVAVRLPDADDVYVTRYDVGASPEAGAVHDSDAVAAFGVHDTAKFVG